MGDCRWTGLMVESGSMSSLCGYLDLRTAKPPARSCQPSRLPLHVSLSVSIHSSRQVLQSEEKSEIR